MFSRRAERAVSALLKKGWAEKAMVGNVIAAEIQWNISRVVSAAPDQTDTDNSMTFIMAKPATASRTSKARPAVSVAVLDSIPASSSCAG